MVKEATEERTRRGGVTVQDAPIIIDDQRALATDSNAQHTDGACKDRPGLGVGPVQRKVVSWSARRIGFLGIDALVDFTSEAQWGILLLQEASLGRFQISGIREFISFPGPATWGTAIVAHARWAPFVLSAGG
eukprot:11327898-Alexandrium_andersonii.AAC.1